MNLDNQKNKAVKSTSESVDEGVDLLKDKASEYEQKLVDTFEPIAKRAQSIGSEVGVWVKKNPIAAAGIALGAGVVIGRILVSRSKKD